MNKIFTGIPIGYNVGVLVNGESVIDMPNAQVVNSSNLYMVDLDNNIFQGYIPRVGDYIKILEIFDDKLLVLASHDSNALLWYIGYFDTNVLVQNIMIRKNTITWNDSDNKNIFNQNKEIIYSLAATQAIQFLYETPNNDYMCILYNDENGVLNTGYVSINEGKFYRYPTLPTNQYPSSPSIKGAKINKDSNNTEYYTRTGNIIKVGDLTLNINKLNVLKARDEIIYNAGFSSKLVDFVKLREGFSSNAYQDSTGHWTIGYGHLITGEDGFTSDSTISIQSAQTLLINDLSMLCLSLKERVEENFPNFKFTTTNQLDAILDLAYNNGLIVIDVNLEHSIFKDILEGKIEDLQLDFCEWCHGDINGVERPIFGLYKRKLEDFIMFTTGMYISFQENNIQELQQNLSYSSNFSNNMWY